MLVSTPHSSRKTRRSGAIPPTPAASVHHAWRARATSSRSCSLARRVRFFHVHPARRSARCTVVGCTRTPSVSARRAAISAKVR